MRVRAGFLVSSGSRRRSGRRRAAPLLAALLFPVALRPARAAPLTVSAAASLTDALEEIGRAYEGTFHEKVAFNFGASSILARQIEEGAPVDVFLSADEANVDRLEGGGRLLPGTRRSVVSNALVIVVERGSTLAIGGVEALADARIRTLALAEPGSVPAGVYARNYLESVGLWEKVRPKVVPVENVRAALAAVEAGNADAAIVYRTDARISRRVRVAYEVPAGSGPAISYGAAAVAATTVPAEARRFLDYLSGPAAAAVFGRYGFLPPRRRR